MVDARKISHPWLSTPDARWTLNDPYPDVGKVDVWSNINFDQFGRIKTLSRSVFIKVLLSLSLFYQTRSYPLYQYQLWSSLTSEPPHQSQRIFTLCCKCCFNKAKQTLCLCKDCQWCKATSTFLQTFLFSKWTVFCRMITSLHGTTRQTFCG